MSSKAEEQYFQLENAEKRRALRFNLAKQAQELAAQKAVGDSVDTDRPDLAARIKALGFDGDSARVFDLMPLVHVAWSDGSVARSERATILGVLEQRGIEADTEAFLFIESLLEEEPDALFLEQSESLLKEVLLGHEHNARDIVELCIAVADASGGFLGFGNRISDEERAVISKVAALLGDASGVQSRLS